MRDLANGTAAWSNLRGVLDWARSVGRRRADSLCIRVHHRGLDR